MEKGDSLNKVPLIECLDIKSREYAVRYGLQPNNSDNGKDEGFTFYEEKVKFKPSMRRIKDIILAHCNEEIDNRIISGFKWKGYDVWLSTENQFNYKAAFDLAVQTNGVNLPIKFKFGTTDNPQYYTFETVQDLGDFYGRAMGYINEQLQWGWETKDSIDWGEYERQLNAI